MDWEAWLPTYRAILQEFGYDEARDVEARDVLDALVADRLPADLDALRRAIRGREAWVVGAAARDMDAVPPDAPLLVADSAAHLVLPFRRPLAIVTDLDGDVPLQLAASAVGVPLFVHAHGDNLAVLERHVPAMRGPLVATTQAAPTKRVSNFGGFTDGDRACCLAVELGARSLALVGFDFDAPAAKMGRDADLKRRKLAWARRIVDGLGVPVRYVRVSASTQA